MRFAPRTMRDSRPAAAQPIHRQWQNMKSLEWEDSLASPGLASRDRPTGRREFVDPLKGEPGRIPFSACSSACQENSRLITYSCVHGSLHKPAESLPPPGDLVFRNHCRIIS